MSRAPPASAEAVAQVARVLRWASTRAGIAGAVVCYFGDFFARMAGTFYSNPLFFRGWGWRLIVWCSAFLDHHVRGYVFYAGGLCAVSVLLSLFLRALGCQRVLNESDSRLGDAPSGMPLTVHPGGRTVAGLLFLPFIPPLFGALAGVMILILAAALFAAYVLVCCLRYGGLGYLWTRAAVQGGIRDALTRRPR